MDLCFRFVISLACLVALLGGASVHAATFGLYRSTDDGRSWRKVGAGLPPDLRIDALGRSGGVRLAGTERGIYVSPDDGATWKRPTRGVPENLKIFQFAAYRDRQYAATARGVWMSADHGDSWTLAGSELVGGKVLSLASTESGLFAGTDGQGVYFTAETEARWQPVGTGLPTRAQIFQFAVQRGTVFAALYARGIYRYEQATRTWMSAGDEYPLSLVSFHDRLFSGRNPGGVFTSSDAGANWRETSRGLPPNAPTWTLASTPNSVLIGTAGHSGLMRSGKTDAAWAPSDRGLPRDGAAIAFGVEDTSILVVVISGR